MKLGSVQFSDKKLKFRFKSKSWYSNMTVLNTTEFKNYAFCIMFILPQFKKNHLFFIYLYLYNYRLKKYFFPVLDTF